MEIASNPTCPSCGSQNDAQLVYKSSSGNGPGQPADSVSRRCQACSYQWILAQPAS
jgi:transposase-like protein